MNTNRISVRYAKALFSAAQEQNIAEQISKDMKLIQQSASNPEFKLMLENPALYPSRKVAVFEQIFAKRISKLTLDFFKLLTKNKREAFLQAIARNYLSIYRKAYGITAVDLTTAQNIDAKFLKDIENMIRIKFKTQVEMQHHTDDSLIGGFIIRLEDELYDGSAASKLKQIEKELLAK